MKPIIKSSFFAQNRIKLTKILGDGPPIVLIAHGLVQRSNDTEYCFEQDRNFYYLSGLDEPDWIMVFDEREEYLIEPEISEVEKTFNGVPDLDKINRETGIKNILSSQEGWKKLSSLKEIRTILPSGEKVGPIYSNPSKRLFLDKLNIRTIDISAEVLRMRTVKREPEIAALRQAITLTGESFNLTKKSLFQAKNEADIEAIFSSHFIRNGTRHGYEPIVAGGKNACTLHYTANNQKLPKNGLVLIDIGAQYGYYSADITRTLKLGKPSDRQLEVKEAVKEAFDKIFKTIKPGMKFEEYQEASSSIMQETIASLNLGKSLSSLYKFFPHAPSHGLGLDVHDAMVGFNNFHPGMVFTLEPGIYIPEEGIGVRYEDDLLITEDGVENLSISIRE